MTVYIVKPDDSVYSINRQVALVGFTLRGEEVVLFEAEQIETIPLTEQDIVCGGVSIVRKAFDRLGFSVSSIPSIPECLSAFAGRDVWQSTMGEARHQVENGQPVFVKPLTSNLKLFTGQPMRQFSDLLSTSHIPDDTEVECAEVIPFVAEFRTFVLQGEVIGVRHYGGNALRFPDPDVINTIVSSYTDAPASYAVDVGVVEDGRTLLVEVNDSYATGAYGLAPALYASFIDQRWQQLRQTNAKPT